MLTFLYVAGRKGFLVDTYVDEAVGEVTPSENGSRWSVPSPQPQIRYGGAQAPTDAQRRSCIAWRTSSALSPTPSRQR